MSTIKQFLAAKFTTNARNIAAFSAICLSAYGLTILSWLENTQQKDIQLNPREAAPDFLVTNARYFNFQPSTSETTQNSSKGTLWLNIQSKTLSHYTDAKMTQFQDPIAQFIDQSNQTWLITANTAIAKTIHDFSHSKTSSEVIELNNNVTITGLPHETITMNTGQITIDTTHEILNTKSHINMDFKGGHLTAGSFQSSIKTEKIQFSDGVRATYYPTEVNH